jgi:hypothetical protein
VSRVSKVSHARKTYGHSDPRAIYFGVGLFPAAFSPAECLHQKPDYRHPARERGIIRFQGEPKKTEI